MKYPRTLHLPWSLAISSDDKVHSDISCFKGKELVYLEKLDGENTVFSSEYIHARSEEGYNKSWQTYIKKIWGEVRFKIVDNLIICAENMYAVHSIEYNRLDSYLYVFGVVSRDSFISWEETLKVCAELNLKAVPELYRGYLIQLPIPETSKFGNICEGYVVRNLNSFKINDFNKNVGKVVRKNHVQTDIHWTKNWKKAELIKNSY